MEISISDFLSYFNAMYWWIIPSVLAVTTALACLLDRLRVWCMGYVDDYETKFELKIIPLLKKLQPILKSGWETGDNGRGFTHNGEKIQQNNGGGFTRYTGGYYQYVHHHDKAVLEDLSDSQARSMCHTLQNGEGATYTPLVIRLGCYLMAFAVCLGFYKLFPTIAIGCGIVYLIMLVARKTMRIGKKLKKHVLDPKAHQETTE